MGPLALLLEQVCLCDPWDPWKEGRRWHRTLRPGGWTHCGRGGTPGWEKLLELDPIVKHEERWVYTIYTQRLVNAGIRRPVIRVGKNGFRDRRRGQPGD